MTVLVGVLCRDGVVVGSDSSMTFSAGEFRTVEQPAEKTFRVEPDVLIAGTGGVGYMQRFQAVVAGLRKKQEWSQRAHIETAKVVCQEMVKDFAFTHAPKGQFGALVGFATKSDCHLCEFATGDFQPEFKLPGTWFVSMGSGQPIVDPFLALLRRTLLRGRQPTLQEGVFATTWALSHAIELNTGGINGPIQIGILAKSSKGSFESKLLTADELAEHEAHVQAVEDHLAAYCDKLGPQNTAPARPPDPPTPKSAPSG
jgi:20S proteasome alpha/beta subunit